MIAFEGRKIVIVGGGMGIGLAGAEMLRELGAQVFVADKDPAAEARLPAETDFAVCDATRPDDVEAMLAEAAVAMGGIDGLFITVGGAALGPLAEMGLDAWDREIAFNLDSVYITCRAALPHLAKAERSAIVTTSSGYAIMAGVDRAAYTAAKAGVIAFSRSLSAIAAPQRTRVNCIAPGPTDTPRFRAMNGGDEGVEQVRQSMPLGTIPTPGDCAKLALFLLSDAASQITGQVIHVNGGLLTP
jgi:NAD(P)-dependent dehydrogenase (short-subunit alcohol dehydrogenase family)